MEGLLSASRQGGKRRRGEERGGALREEGIYVKPSCPHPSYFPSSVCLTQCKHFLNRKHTHLVDTLLLFSTLHYSHITPLNGCHSTFILSLPPWCWIKGDYRHHSNLRLHGFFWKREPQTHSHTHIEFTWTNTTVCSWEKINQVPGRRSLEALF